MSRIKKAFSKAWQENHNAQLESKKLDFIDSLLDMEKQRMISHEDVVAGKDLILHCLGEKLYKTITHVSYEGYIKDVKRAYKLLCSNMIDVSIYRRIVNFRLIDSRAILQYYKKGGFDIEISHSNLVSAIEDLADFYKYGVINKDEFNCFVDDCFNAKRGFLFSETGLPTFGGGRNLHYLLMDKIKKGYRVVDSEIRKRRIVINMEDSTKQRVQIKKYKFLWMTFYSKI